MLSVKQIINHFNNENVKRILYKKLSENDNSKNQPYLGGSFDVLSVLPFDKITEFPGLSAANFKCSIKYFWLNDSGMISYAPHTQLICYPKYPEVRLSGFLRGCENAPSKLMTGRIPKRILFFGITNDRRVIAYVRMINEALNREIEYYDELGQFGALTEIHFEEGPASREQLFEKFLTFQGSWRRARYLRNTESGPEEVFYNSKCDNCHGMTLEAEMGVLANAQVGADWRGWELKGKKVKSEEEKHQLASKPVTMITPQPDGGLFHDDFSRFMRTYGRFDGNRYNFAFRHHFGREHEVTGLTMTVNGFNPDEGSIEVGGSVQLMTEEESVVASWSFSSLMKLWNRKHQKFAIIPSLVRDDSRFPEVRFLNVVGIGVGTNFTFFLSSITNGQTYHDPGHWWSPSGGRHHRSQWRTNSPNLNSLYKSFEIVDVENL
jgi:hypothetical protein|tara:strand:+ start:374 stop:1678 length:1305 start_codon:yes stop_codon:yes gene_type:complete